MNNVTLVGRLTKDPELRTTNSGISYLFFTLAVDRPYASAGGERQTDFISCVAWRNTAETMARYLHKGARIGVIGSIQTRTYDDASGVRKYITEVNCNSFSFLESKAEREQYASGSFGNQTYGTGYNQQQSFAEPRQPRDLQNRTQNQASRTTGNVPNPFGLDDDFEDPFA